PVPWLFGLYLGLDVAELDHGEADREEHDGPDPDHHEPEQSPEDEHARHSLGRYLPRHHPVTLTVRPATGHAEGPSPDRPGHVPFRPSPGRRVPGGSRRAR